MSRLDDLVEKYKLGEIEFDVVFKETKPLMAKLSRRMGIRDWEFEDYFQEGAIILFNCIRDYKEESNFSFLTYFSNNIKWKFFRIHNGNTLVKVPCWIHEKKGYERPKFVSNKQNNNNDKEYDLFDTYLVTDSFETPLLDVVSISEILDRLEGIDKKFISLLAKGYSQTEIANGLNIKKGALNERYKRIKARLRKMFMEEI